MRARGDMQLVGCVSPRPALDRSATKELHMTDTDRIEKKVVLRASRARVWRALSTAAEFGEWFRVKLEGDFQEGAAIFGRITYPGYEHLKPAKPLFSRCDR